MTKIVEDPFRLYNGDPNITEADGVAATWSDVWKYQVPIGSTLILKPTNTLAAYLEDSSPAECGASTCEVRVEKRDSSESDVVIVFGSDLYITVKEFQEVPLMARLSVPEEGLLVNEREWLVIMVKDDATLDASDSYFEIRTAKIRKTLGA